MRTAAGYEDAPVDAIELAACCGLDVVLSDVRESVLLGETIFVPRRARLSRVHGLIAHELGHWSLARVRQPDDERDASYLAGALLVPWADLTRELRRGWDLDALRARHVHASAEMIARRIAQLRDAGVAIYDEGRLRMRAGRRDLAAPNERALVDEVLRERAPVRVDDLTGAWPVIDGARERVVVIASA